jgi:hypothetical protein
VLAERPRVPHAYFISQPHAHHLALTTLPPKKEEPAHKRTQTPHGAERADTELVEHDAEFTVAHDHVAHGGTAHSLRPNATLSYNHERRAKSRSPTRDHPHLQPARMGFSRARTHGTYTHTHKPTRAHSATATSPARASAVLREYLKRTTAAREKAEKKMQDKERVNLQLRAELARQEEAKRKREDKKREEDNKRKAMKDAKVNEEREAERRKEERERKEAEYERILEEKKAEIGERVKEDRQKAVQNIKEREERERELMEDEERERELMEDEERENENLLKLQKFLALKRHRDHEVLSLSPLFSSLLFSSLLFSSLLFSSLLFSNFFLTGGCEI